MAVDERSPFVTEREDGAAPGARDLESERHSGGNAPAVDPQYLPRPVHARRSIEDGEHAPAVRGIGQALERPVEGEYSGAVVADEAAIDEAFDRGHGGRAPRIGAIARVAAAGTDRLAVARTRVRPSGAVGGGMR